MAYTYWPEKYWQWGILLPYIVMTSDIISQAQFVCAFSGNTELGEKFISSAEFSGDFVATSLFAGVFTSNARISSTSIGRR